MSIRNMVENRVWDEQSGQWILTAPKTHAKAVETSGGGNVQDALDAIPGQISGAIAEVRGGAPEDGNTLGKLYDTIETIKALLQADDPSLDTLQEIVDYVKKHGDDLDKIGTDKVDYDDIVNALDAVGTVEGKVLDARQGKVLKDAIDTLKSSLESLQEQAGNYVTQDQVTAIAATARPVVSENAPLNPVDGQIWYRPAGTIEV